MSQKHYIFQHRSCCLPKSSCSAKLLFFFCLRRKYLPTANGIKAVMRRKPHTSLLPQGCHYLLREVSRAAEILRYSSWLLLLGCSLFPLLLSHFKRQQITNRDKTLSKIALLQMSQCLHVVYSCCFFFSPLNNRTMTDIIYSRLLV